MTINKIQERIIRDMASLREWFERYEYLIREGKNLKPPEDGFRVQENLIQGCQSKVWVYSDCVEGRVQYRADSDALITKGMIALLLKVLNNQLPQEIVDADLYFIEKTGLASNLSPSRADGLASIVKEMRRQAAAFISVKVQPT